MLFRRASHGKTIAAAQAALKRADAKTAADLIRDEINCCKVTDPKFWLVAHQIFLAAGEVKQSQQVLEAARENGVQEAEYLRARASLFDKLHHWRNAFDSWEKLNERENGSANTAARMVQSTLHFDLSQTEALLERYADLKYRNFGIFRCHIRLADAL